MYIKKLVSIIGITIAVSAITHVSMGEEYHLMVQRVGDGSDASRNVAREIALVDVRTDGTTRGTVLAHVYEAPSQAVSDRITRSPTWSTFGQINLSGDGKYVLLAGTGATLGGGIKGAEHVIGRFNLATSIWDTSTRLPASSCFDGGFIRGVISPDGVNFWVVGNGQSQTQIHHTTLGSSMVEAVTSKMQLMQLRYYGDYMYASRNVGNSFDYGRGIFRISPKGYVEADGSFTNGRLKGSGFDWQKGDYNDFGFLDDDTLLVANAGEPLQAIQVLKSGADGWKLFSELPVPGASLRYLDFRDCGNYLQVFYVTGVAESVSTLWAAKWYKSARAGSWSQPEKLYQQTLKSGYTLGGVRVYKASK